MFQVGKAIASYLVAISDRDKEKNEVCLLALKLGRLPQLSQEVGAFRSVFRGQGALEGLVYLCQDTR